MKIKKHFWYSIILLFAIYWSFSAYKIYKTFNYEFNGTIQKVTYESGKYRPTITVNNQQFDLEWVRLVGDEENVVVGDSVIKQKENQWMIVIKK